MKFIETPISAGKYLTPFGINLKLHSRDGLIRNATITQQHALVVTAYEVRFAASLSAVRDPLTMPKLRYPQAFNSKRVTCRLSDITPFNSSEFEVTNLNKVHQFLSKISPADVTQALSFATPLIYEGRGGVLHAFSNQFLTAIGKFVAPYSSVNFRLVEKGPSRSLTRAELTPVLLKTYAPMVDANQHLITRLASNQQERIALFPKSKATFYRNHTEEGAHRG